LTTDFTDFTDGGREHFELEPDGAKRARSTEIVEEPIFSGWFLYASSAWLDSSLDSMKKHKWPDILVTLVSRFIVRIIPGCLACVVCGYRAILRTLAHNSASPFLSGNSPSRRNAPPKNYPAEKSARPARSTDRCFDGPMHDMLAVMIAPCSVKAHGRTGENFKRARWSQFATTSAFS
jgi:hypothetical protein